MKEQIIYIFLIYPFCIFSETDLQHTFCLLKQKTKQIKSKKQRNITIRYKKKSQVFFKFTDVSTKEDVFTFHENNTIGRQKCNMHVMFLS